MAELKLKDFLLKVGDYVWIRLDVYVPNKEDIQEEVEFQQRFCDVMTFDGKMSDKLREKVESLMECTVEYIGTNIEDRVAKDYEPYSVPVIVLDIMKD